MTLTPKQRQQVFEMFGGRCAYCGCELPAKGWHADHVEPVWREWWKRKPKETWEFVDDHLVHRVEKQKVGMERPERDCIENMFPSCRACNIDKTAMSLDDWRKSLERKIKVLRDNYSAFRHAERFGLVTANEKPVVFYFEQVMRGA